MNMNRQNTPYGCGMYAVANSTGRPEFITAERLNKSKTGNTIAQLSVWLQEDWAGFGVDVMYYNVFGEILPEIATGYHPENVGEILPVMIEVSKTKISKSHLIGGHIDHNRILTVFDSLKEEPFVTDLTRISEHYDIVRGVYAFHYLDGRGWLILKSND